MSSRGGKDEPSLGEVKAALDKITGSEIFRHSPQLIAFLRFVGVSRALVGVAWRSCKEVAGQLSRLQEALSH